MRLAEGSERVVAVGAGKGGAGVSIVATLLALGAAEHGIRTLLVDTDTDIGTLDRLLGVEPAMTLGALRTAGADVRDAILPVLPSLDLLAGGGGEPMLSDVERRGLLKRVASLFESYDLVILDAGSRLDGVLRAIGAGAGRLLAVSTAEPIAVAATYALVKAIEARVAGFPMELLINRDDGAAARRAADELSSAAVRFLGHEVVCSATIPEDPSLRAALGAGMSLLDAAAGSPAADLICALGVRLREAPVPAARTSAAARTA
jgi:flagellar biosynthesis protein FlhG